MLKECELLQTLVFLSIMKSVFFNNMKNSTEKLLRWCINKGLPRLSRFPWALGALVEVKNLAWLFNSFLFHKWIIFVMNTQTRALTTWAAWGESQDVHIVHSRSEFKHFSFAATCLSSGHTFPCPPWPPC